MSNTPTSSAQVAEGMNLEAEREAFEAWHRSKFETKHSTGQPTRDMHNGIYAENYGPKDQQLMWEVWQAARTAAPVAEGVALPPLPKADKWWREEFGLGDSTVHEGHSDEQMQQYAFSAIAPYAERIRLLEQDNGLLSLIADQFKARLASADAQIEELERELATFKGEHATQLATKSIDTHEFRRLVDATGNPNLDHHSTLTALIAYIDGRTAGPAVPEGYAIVPEVPTKEMIVAIERKVDEQLVASGMWAQDMQRQDGADIYEAVINAAPKPLDVLPL